MKQLFTLLLAMSLGIAGFSQVTTYNVGDQVSNFTVTDAHGNTHDLYSYCEAGKTVFLDFFFDTCGPCQQTVPYFTELHEKYGCNSGDLICISMNNGSDSDAEVLAFEQTYAGANAAPAVSADGGAGAVDTDFGVQAYPTYCVIGSDKTLKAGDVWPVSDVSTFEGAFPAGTNIQPMPCAPAAVEEVLASLGIQAMYPNPATESTNIFINLEAPGAVTIEVMDVLGNVVISDKATDLSLGQNRYELSTSSLTTGNYFVRVTQPGSIDAVTKLAVVN